MNEPKGKIPKSDLDRLLAFSSSVETLCALHGDSNLLQEARTVQRIAIVALYECRYQKRWNPQHNDEYPYPVSEENSEPPARFMRRIPDEDSAATDINRD